MKMPPKFSVQHYLQQYRTAAENVSTEVYRERLTECAACSHRDRGTCRILNRDVKTFAVKSASECPEKLWPLRSDKPKAKSADPVKAVPQVKPVPQVENKPAGTGPAQESADEFRGSITPQMDVELVERLIELPAAQQHPDWWRWENVQAAHRNAADRAIESIGPRPPALQPRGVVIVGGGRFLVSAYVTIRVLRHVGCQLPMQLWHLEGEVNQADRNALAAWHVQCVNASNFAAAKRFRFLPGHRWQGWQLKAFALAHCPFDEVLQLDADCYPVRNPEFVFEWKPYRQLGAAFWPDVPKHADMRPAHCWKIFGVEPLADLPTESGQLLVNKSLCWREICLALHYNSHADFVYHIIYGDKDTYPIAWQQLGRRYARMSPAPFVDDVALRQRDESGETLFIHRVHDKFRLPDTRFPLTPQHHDKPKFCRQFPLEQFCHDALNDAVALFGSRDLERQECNTLPKV